MNQEEVWDSIAESWNNFRQKIYEKELYKLNWKKGKLLDVGCGNCRNLLPFNNLELYGIDFSSKMLELAKKFCDKHNIKANLQKANMKKLPFKDNYFDYCLCLASLHIMNKKDADKSLKEIFRVLKKDGQCLISVWNKYGLISLFFKEREKYIPWKTKDKIYSRYYFFYNHFQFKKLLLKNNFKIIKSGKILDKNIKFLIQK
jgi:ubiquinone/menaquinone biosynthesis C-methylase UbiE